VPVVLISLFLLFLNFFLNFLNFFYYYPGHIGKVLITFSWFRFFVSPIEIAVDDVYLVVAPLFETSVCASPLLFIRFFFFFFALLAADSSSLIRPQVRREKRRGIRL